MKFFEKVLVDEQKDCPHLVVLTLIPDEILQQLLEFIYLGELMIDKVNMPTLMKYAQELGVVGLVDDITVIDDSFATNKQEDLVVAAAEALQTLGNSRSPNTSIAEVERNFVNYNTVPRHTSLAHINQPSPGSQPPQQDALDLGSLHYKAAASREIFSAGRTDGFTGMNKKRKLSSSTQLENSSASPTMPEHTANQSAQMLIVS